MGFGFGWNRGWGGCGDWVAGGVVAGVAVAAVVSGTGARHGH